MVFGDPGQGRPMSLIFRDRIDAGRQLAGLLGKWRSNPGLVVIALPRGGVPVAREVARALGAPLDIVCPRKIGAPHNPEFAVGAITESGEGLFDTQTIESLHISREYLQQAVEKEMREAEHRLALYRAGRGKRSLLNKIVLIVDDGLATGSTMKAAILSVQAEGPLKILVAVPVSPPDTAAEIEELVDEFYCLSRPPYFSAVGQFYSDFRATSDQEVIEIMKEEVL